MTYALASMGTGRCPEAVEPGRSKPLATPNYAYEKRQRELAKKRKAEEKRQRKQVRDNEPTTPPQPDNAAPPPAPSEPSS
jgi:hypothetical protein